MAESELSRATRALEGSNLVLQEEISRLIVQVEKLLDKTEELEAENAMLRAEYAKTNGNCLYCHLPAEDMSKCEHGFPGCSRADDLMMFGIEVITKLWIDDVRPPPDYHEHKMRDQGDWYWAKTSEDALRVLTSMVTDISFDHDLGGDDTAMPVAKHIEEKASLGLYPRIRWTVHSANPVGRANLVATMQSAERFWNELEASVSITDHGVGDDTRPGEPTDA